MVRDVVVGDILAQLLGDCAEVLEAQAAAILVSDAQGGLTLLSSTTAEAAALEMLQAQERVGPCVDALDSGDLVLAYSESELLDRWRDVGQAIVTAGFSSVEAVPMTWRGRAIGGLNLFHVGGLDVDDERRRLSKAFADVATIVLVHAADVPTEQVTARVYDAVMARGTIEQAKGVLAEVEGLDMHGAQLRLGELATETGGSITDTARRIIARAQRGTGP